MRILWISHSPWIGGAELALAEAVEALDRRGHRLDVVLPAAGPLEDRLRSHASIHICKHKPWATFDSPVRTRVAWIGYDLCVAAPRIARLARATGADVLVSNTVTTFAGALAARAAGLPHAWFVHEYGAEDHGLRFVLGRRLSHALMRTSMGVCIVNSEALRRHYAVRLPGVEVRVARYAVQARQAARAADRDAKRFRLILVGTMKPSKGQRDAIAALGVLRQRGLDVELELVGGGDDTTYVGQLEELTEALRLGDRVRFVPFDPEPSARVQAADVVLMCSPQEALGRVTVEAMKAGKPVVGAAGGATGELVRDGFNGYLYRPGDERDLAQCLERCYGDREGISEMGRRGREWALETFNLDRYGAELESALLRALSER